MTAAITAAATVELAAPLIRCEDLVVGFGRRVLMPAFDLTIRRGELVLVVGHNGAGKTTFVRTLLGLQPPVAGAARCRPGLRCTYVPQATAIDALVPLQVQELVRWGALRGWGFLRPWERLRGLGEAGAAAGAGAGGAVVAPSIEGLRRRRFGELSGGQRQRVLLARLVGGDAELAVLDEPTASMDGPTSEATFAALRRLTIERRTTSIVVSHAAAIAAPYVDRIVLLDPEGDGVLAGSPAEVAAAPRFRGLFGAIAVGRAGGAEHAGGAEAASA
jgi:zinc transport system ATP-binding protein